MTGETAPIARPRSRWHAALNEIARLVAMVLLGGLLTATLMRFAPGFTVDEVQLDYRQSEQTVQRVIDERLKQQNILAFYAAFLGRYLQGDLGESQSLHQPVKLLLADRWSPTAKTVGVGLLLAWLLGFGLPLVAALAPRLNLNQILQPAVGFIQCIPVAALALLLAVFWRGGPLMAGITVGIVVFPRVAPYVINIVGDAIGKEYVISALARGVPRPRVILMHVLPAVSSQLAALAAVSAATALSAAVPVETILDIPGIGQLAWQAALSRDLTLLVNVSMVLGIVIMTANLIAELSCRSARSEVTT